MELFKEISDLLFPSRCISCSVIGPPLCPPCKMEWSYHSRVRVLHSDTVRIPVYSAVSYTPVVRKVLLSAKENHLRAADNLIVEALVHSITHAKSLHHIDQLVPIPSRYKVSRTRGRSFIHVLTTAASQDVGIGCMDALTHARFVRDQSELHLKERWNNLHGALVVPTEKRPSSKVRVLLVDDLITTGATLTEGARALELAGFEVIGAVTAATSEPVRLAHQPER